MGFIRGGFLVIASVLFFVALLAGNLFLTVTMSLDYEVIKPALISAVKEVVENELDLDEVVNGKFENMTLYCQNNSEFVFSEEERTFVIPCEVVSQGPEAVIDHGINGLVEGIYSEETEGIYGINLISENSKAYWKSLFYFSLIAIVILFILIFFLVEKKSNSFIMAGILLIISSLPFAKLDVLVDLLAEPIISLALPAGVDISVSSLAGLILLFFTKSYSVFILILILGIIVLIIGLILKFFGVGFKINEFFSRSKKRRGNVPSTKVPVTKIPPTKASTIKTPKIKTSKPIKLKKMK